MGSKKPAPVFSDAEAWSRLEQRESYEELRPVAAGVGALQGRLRSCRSRACDAKGPQTWRSLDMYHERSLPWTP